MTVLDLPDGKRLTLSHAMFGFNGTLAVDGCIDGSVVGPLKHLARKLTCVVLTTDTYGTAERAASELGLALFRVADGLEKARLLNELRQGAGSRTGIVAVGNGRSDAGMLRVANLSICVVGREGAASGALLIADVVATSGQAALQLLLHPNRLVATLRS